MLLMETNISSWTSFLIRSGRVGENMNCEHVQRGSFVSGSKECHIQALFLVHARRGSVYFSFCLEKEQAVLCTTHQKLGEHPVGIQQYDLRGAATVTSCV